MQYLDVSEYVHPKPVLKNNFNTHMLFRCTSREFAEDLRNGKLFLNTPGVWVQKEKANGKGQGDALEGVFYGTDNPKDNPILKAYANNPDTEEFEHEGFIFLRRKEILNLRCVCFYGLHDKDFIKKIDSKGRAYLQRVIPVSYFTDFNSDTVEENYDTIPRSEQPVVAVIDKPHVFFERIRKALYKLGVEDNDIIISPVEYIQMHTHHYAALAFPRELLLKDIFFEQQSEVRLIVSTKNKVFYDYLKMHNNTIDIGTLDDIISIYDYYFRDMIIQKSNNQMVFTLPKPEFVSFNEMKFSEMIEEFVKINSEEYYDLSKEEKEEAINELKAIILKKYDVNISLTGKSIYMDRVPEEYAEEFYQGAEVENAVVQLEQKVKNALKENDVEYAIQLCSNTSLTGRILEMANFLLVDIYRKSQRMNEMMQQIEKCLINGYKEFEVLNIRSNYYHSIGEYEKAILDLIHMQEIRGYFYQIYGNIGINYISLKKYKEAVEVFSKAIELQNDYAYAYYNRGVAHFFLGDMKNTKIDMEEAMRLEPDNQFYVSEYRKCFGNNLNLN